MRTVGRRLITIGALVAVSAVAQAAEPVRVVESGILDEMTLYVEAPPAGSTVVIRRFDASSADLGTGAEGGKQARVDAVKTIQASGPGPGGAARRR